MGYGGDRLGWVGMGRVMMGLLDWAGRDGKALDGTEGCTDMGLSQWVHQDRLLRASERPLDVISWVMLWPTMRMVRRDE